MDRDRDEWRRPWRDEDTPSRPAPAFSGAGSEGPQASEGSGVGHGTDTQPITRYPLPPPTGWGEGHQGPGSPAGSVRPPDTTGTVDAPQRGRRGLGLGAVVVAALVGALVATGVTLGLVDLAGDDGEGDAAAAPPSIEVDGEATEVVPAVAEAVTPSVVSISVEGAGPGDMPFDGPQQRPGVGSGVIYRSDGYILTNHHVIEGAESVEVRLATGELHDAQIVGSDELNDLALVRIDEEGLPAIEIRPPDERLIVGETVVAIGSPFGLEGSVTSGIISALNRDLQFPDEETGRVETIPSLVQTDAAINPGNSGGALVDANGRLIGLNTAILTGTGAHQGVGFAVPADQAVSSADQLIEQGEVRHALLGVAGESVTPGVAEEFGLEVGQGAIVREVEPDSGAAAAGVQEGDIIVAVDGEELETMVDLIAAVRARQPGDVMEITVIRDGAQEDIEVELGER